ncbi:MAG: TonB-dependent receptor [Epsilonproteobacteria bacterium]|nr:TonB-dependent receptor [Campylobacterota bacterium]
MKTAKGFRGRYFSLAAIAVTVSCVNLMATEASVTAHERRDALQGVQQADEEQLEDIVVDSAMPTPSILKNITSDVTIITSEQLEENHYHDLIEALRDQADIQVVQNGGVGQTSSFTLRGMHAKYVVVLLDGIRLNDPTNPSAYAQLERFSLADVDHIEIVKGAQSGVWGADAAGGVINIVTKKGEKGLHADIGVMGGSDNTYHGETALSYGTEQYDIKAGFAGLKSDGIPPREVSTFDAGDTERTYYVKGGVNLPMQTRLEGSYRKIVSDFDYDAGWGETSQKASGSSDIDLFGAKLTHRHEAVTLTLHGSGSRFDRDYFDAEYKGHDYSGGLTGSFAYDQGSVDAGYIYREAELERYNDADSDGKLENNAVFAALTHRVDEIGLLVNAALRYDDFKNYDAKTTGKIGMRYTLPFLQKVALRANVGTAYRVPSLYERYGDGQYTLENVNVRPEDTTSYDIGLEGYGLKVTGFYNEIEDMVTYVMDPVTYQGRYENLSGTAELKGVDISFAHALPMLLSYVSVGYTYTDAKDADDNRVLNVPRNRATLEWSLYPMDHLRLVFGAEYADERPAYGGAMLDSYTVCRAALTYDTDRYGTFFVKGNNIFDEDYTLVEGYNTEEASFFAGWNYRY